MALQAVSWNPADVPLGVHNLVAAQAERIAELERLLRTPTKMA